MTDTHSLPFFGKNTALFVQTRAKNEEARKIQKEAFIKEGKRYIHLGYLTFIGKKS